MSEVVRGRGTSSDAVVTSNPVALGARDFLRLRNFHPWHPVPLGATIFVAAILSTLISVLVTEIQPPRVRAARDPEP